MRAGHAQILVLFCFKKHRNGFTQWSMWYGTEEAGLQESEEARKVLN